MTELRWVTCSQGMDWSTSRYRHLNRKGSLDTFCSSSASTPDIWRGNTTKPQCQECVFQAEKRGISLPS